MHLASLDRVLAMLKAGKSNEARMAMIAITTNSSIKVNPELSFLRAFNDWLGRTGCGCIWTTWSAELFSLARQKIGEGEEQ